MIYLLRWGNSCHECWQHLLLVKTLTIIKWRWRGCPLLSRQTTCKTTHSIERIKREIKSVNQYNMIIWWLSLKIQLYLFTIPKFPERLVMSCTHEKTRSEAVYNREDVIKMYLEVLKIESVSIPELTRLQIAWWLRFI